MIKRLSVLIAEDAGPRVKKLKSILYTNIVSNPVLCKEQNLYNEITTNHFSDRGVAKAFLEEVLKAARQTKSSVVNKELIEICENHAVLLEEIRNSVVAQTTTKNFELNHIISETFQYIRTPSPTLQQSRLYYKNFETLLEHLSNASTEFEPLQKPVEIPHANLVVERMVKRFQDKYSSLTESQKEVLQDFLNIRSLDRFKSSLLNRLSKLSARLKEHEKKNPDIPKISEMRERLNEECDFISKSKDININDVMLRVCDYTEVADNIQQYIFNASSSSANNSDSND